MSIHRRPLRRRLFPLLAGALLLTSAAAPAAATPQTILRGLGNVILSPLDAALAPVSTFIGLRQNLANIDDSPGVRMFYPVPAYFYAVYQRRASQPRSAWSRQSLAVLGCGRTR